MPGTGVGQHRVEPLEDLALDTHSSKTASIAASAPASSSSEPGVGDPPDQRLGILGGALATLDRARDRVAQALA